MTRAAAIAAIATRWLVEYEVVVPDGDGDGDGDLIARVLAYQVGRISVEALEAIGLTFDPAE